jgi:hypothetical protein
MTDELVTTLVAVLTAIIGVAILAVIVRKGSTTTKFINDTSAGFATIVGKAVSPVNSSTYLNFSNAFSNLNFS